MPLTHCLGCPGLELSPLGCHILHHYTCSKEGDEKTRTLFCPMSDGWEEETRTLSHGFISMTGWMRILEFCPKGGKRRLELCPKGGKRRLELFSKGGKRRLELCPKGGKRRLELCPLGVHLFDWLAEKTRTLSHGCSLVRLAV